jgi:hypothetical protein
MAGRTPSVKKYVVRLSDEEREQLQTLIRKGKSPAKRLLKARILLKTDVSEAGEGWSDELSPIFGDGLIGQAAVASLWLAGLATTSSPSVNFTPRIIFGN